MAKVKKPRKWASWSRKQRGAYFRALSCLACWNEHGYQCLWVMLSSWHAKGTAPDEETLKRLSPDFESLRQMIATRFGYKDLEFVKILTREGGGVIHVVIAWRGARLFYIPQRWLSAAWRRVHGANYVWIEKVKTGQGHRRRLSEYLVSQYVASQEDFIRCDYSYRKTFGFPLLRVWREFKRFFPEQFRKALWYRIMAGDEVVSGEGLVWGLSSLRANYPAFFALEKARMAERSERIKVNREKRRVHGLEYGKVSKALADAYDFVASGKTWRDAAEVA